MFMCLQSSSIIPLSPFVITVLSIHSVIPSLSIGSNAESSTTNMNNLKRAPQLRQPQPLLYITNTGAGAQRIRRH